MIEQLQLYGERQMQYGEKRAKWAMKKVRAQNNFKILPKNRAPVPGYSSSDENILGTRLLFPFCA